ncbi:MAG: hypothetical protein MUF54_24595, partial [Polyangiaceae bacterium]|nr:hypothetical protein [Polyangiaceae bacterium]
MRPLALLKPLASIALVLAALPLGCAEQPVSVDVRSLEQSGDVAFLCLRQDDADRPGRWTATCNTRTLGSDGSPVEHLYAMVTQPIRGEVALIDLTEGEVSDVDPATPGFNFIPVGANPGAIVSSPRSTVTFVGSAEAGRESIWIIPSSTLRKGPPRLTSFAACALPSAPGEMMVLVAQNDDPVDALLVTLPDLGAIVVLDAQTMLDQAPGTVVPCPAIGAPIKLNPPLPPGAFPLETTPPFGYPPGEDAAGGVCDLTMPVSVAPAPSYTHRPAGLALDSLSETLYIADEAAPFIHVLDVTSPSNIRQLKALYPMSVERPERDVTTRKVAISPLTSDGKRFLYATDVREGSVMVFDVSPGAGDSTPLQRNDPKRSPFQPRDRIALGVP